MSDIKETLKKLHDKFPADRISWRVGSTNKDKTKGLALAYVDARDVMERLDSVVGAENWQCKYSHANGKTVCDLAIRINGEWVWKANGAGDSDVEAEKGALSDAFKRAAVLWGIGRYLYDFAAVWVTLDGGKYIHKDELPKLAKLAAGAKVRDVFPEDDKPKAEPPPEPEHPARTVGVALLNAAKKASSLDDLQKVSSDKRLAEVKEWRAEAYDAIMAAVIKREAEINQPKEG